MLSRVRGDGATHVAGLLIRGLLIGAILAAAALGTPSQQRPAPADAVSPRPSPEATVALMATVGLATRVDEHGLVLVHYPGLGYRFNPLLTFARLNAVVTARDARATRLLADAAVALGRQRGDGIVWTYEFPYHGGPASWTSGFAQAVAAQSLARAAGLLCDRTLLAAADGAFRALDHGLLMPLGGGAWVREYGYTSEVILNAQLQSVISLASYARIVGTVEARSTSRALYVAARTLLPRFSLGHWSLYALGGRAATSHYHAYHLSLLRRLAADHPRDPVWADTLRAWDVPL